ncbi:BH3456 [Halalkalibacterium halodurans C-125]|uniref:BH3456 protein n=1 Tax=Halalkalibacterium halodurans (strain ATCC BAA-125 / DSM 18197 / FERM 7344 / JCM 9153 / C-125) TaxID=272558 RepID=Q9K7B0_HALH5|nr:BH3456 [Halalkalibacterium halodurans C-125]
MKHLGFMFYFLVASTVYYYTRKFLNEDIGLFG